MKTILLTLILALSAPLAAQEKLTLSAPVVKSTTEWTLVRLVLDIENSTIYVFLKSNTGEVKEVQYRDIPAIPAVLDAEGNVFAPAVAAQPVATNLLTVVNTANMSVLSLKKRIFTKLQADGHLGAGTVGGQE